MNAMFREGASLAFTSTSTPTRVVRCLGGGGQGQVFEVSFAGEPMAMKWIYPSCVQRDPGLPERLRNGIRTASPNASFLWPIVLLQPTPACQAEQRLPPGSFGYLMKLRPPGFVGAVEHGAGRLSISLRAVLRACFLLAEAFHALHSKGLCYKDISLGNLFIDPASGCILICDNDNVDVNGSPLGGVRGTPGFMAPEVLLGRSAPGTQSDLFSLAVLLFRLLTRHDPFRGRLELQIRCFDEPARLRLYGEDPVFIFSEEDGRNRPDPIEHPAPLLTWPIYPPELQGLFQRSLGVGARQAAQRAYTGEWMKALARTLDQRRSCPHCQQEVFPEPGQPGRCWACGGTFPAGPCLRAPAASVATAAENELHPHHFDPLAPERIDAPLGRIVSHPGDASLLGLENLTSQPWRLEFSGGESLELPPGKRCNLASLERIHTSCGSLVVER